MFSPEATSSGQPQQRTSNVVETTMEGEDSRLGGEDASRKGVSAAEIDSFLMCCWLKRWDSEIRLDHA